MLLHSRLHIAAWSAWAPSIETPEEWGRWVAQGGAIQSVVLDKCKPLSVPAMLRRRLSPLGALAVMQLEKLDVDLASIPMVFASEHGELQRTLGLLKSLSSGDELSPMQFSLSVHNANAGILSIAQNNRQNMTAVATANGELGPILLEAQAMLEYSDAPFVACVIYDQPLPDVYQRLAVFPEFPYAAAFLLSKVPSGNGTSLTLTLNNDAVDSFDHSTPQALHLIRFILTGYTKTLFLPSVTGSQWLCERYE